MNYVCGDTHGRIDSKKIEKIDYPVKNLLIAGDVGILWENLFYKNKDLIKFYSSFPFAILFIDGNHDNHPLIAKLPQVEMFGSVVGKVSEKIFHLKRGEVYTIDDKKIFTFGGADSIDKHWRTPGVNWWKEEIPSFEEMKKGLDNLKLVNNEVDYIVTHSCPTFVAKTLMGKEGFYYLTVVENYFEEISKIVKFKKWFFGHFHKDKVIDNFICLYDKIKPLE